MIVRLISEKSTNDGLLVGVFCIYLKKVGVTVAPKIIIVASFVGFNIAKFSLTKGLPHQKNTNKEITNKIIM